MRLILTACLIITILASAVSPAIAQTMPVRNLSFKVGEFERRALLVNEAASGQLQPVVIVLHGGNGNADAQRIRTGFDDLARAEGFTVVYAEGTQWAPGQHAWNTGYLLRRQIGEADDIAYLDALIDLLINEQRADPTRIYVTGGSNGAMMALVYATQRPQKLAAVAPIVGAMFSFDTRPIVPLPIMFINGGLDNEVPIEGGMSRNRLVRNAQTAPFKSLEESVSFWVAANGSQSVPVVEQNGSVTTRTFPAGPTGAETVVVVDSVGGHGWPGSKSNREENVPIQAFRGTDRVWAFFKDKRREPGAMPAQIKLSPSRDQSALQAAEPVAVKLQHEQAGHGRFGSVDLSNLDKNGDKLISRAEWLAFGLHEQRFFILDTDRSGSLTPIELKQGLARGENRRKGPKGQGRR